MADKDVDEQFAAIMAHWHEDALGLDPFGDPEGPGPADGPGATDGPATDEPGDTSGRTSAAGDTGPAATPAPPAPSGPASPADAASPVNPAPPMSPMTPERAAGLGWRQHVPEPEPEPEDHFVPPPPAPLPSADDKHFWLMMVSLIGGPLLFLYLILFNRDGNGWWMVCGIAMTVAGFVLLVLRQPFERDEDDDGVRL